MRKADLLMLLPPEGTEDSFVVEAVNILGSVAPVDIRISDGRFASITPSPTGGTSTFLALPGFVDMHTHLREPGGEAAETISSGTRAAAAGGYTDVFAMANTNPTTDSVARVEETRAKAAGAPARVHPVASATLGLAGERLTDIRALRAAGVTMFSDDGRCVNDDGLVYDLLTILAETGGIFAQHAQSTNIAGKGVINAPVADAIGCCGWPAAGEESIVARDIALARATGGRLHLCHISTKRTVDLVRWAKSVGAPVTAEVTPHHLMLDDHEAVERGPLLKVNPPLRSEEDIKALREGLRDGTIDVIGTDHAPHPAETKTVSWDEASFGMTGIETALPVVAEVLTDVKSGHVDWHRLVQVMSSMPATICGIDDIAGQAIEVGAHANLCIVESGGPWVIELNQQLSKSSNSPFAGFPIRHRVVGTVNAGRVTRSIR